MSQVAALLTTPALREVQDIVEAAADQGWDLQRAGHHLRLVPPEGSAGVPVGLSGSPSNKFWRHQIIRQLRRSGLTWPWPPAGGGKKLARAQRNQEKKKVITQSEPVTEAWRTIDTMSKYEISNGAHVRNRLTGKLIVVAPNGLVNLTDDKGRRREKSVRALVRTHFGHSPIKNVVPETTAVSHRSRESLRLVEQPSNQEESMTATLEVDVSTNGHAGRWEPVLIEGVNEGYEVNARAEVLAPKNDKFKERTNLTPTMRGGRLFVNLRMTNGKYRQYPLDEIVLEAFQMRPGKHWVPEYRDHDPANCAAANLRWSEGAQKPGAAEPAPPVQVPDEPSEPQRADPEVVDVPVIDRATNELVEDVAPLEDEVVSSPEPVEEEKPKRKAPARRKAKAPARGKAKSDGLEVLRVYRLAGVQLTVDAEGNGELSKKAKLSTLDMEAMAEVLGRAVEMNRLMGIK